jgi:hypothetical protein
MARLSCLMEAVTAMIAEFEDKKTKHQQDLTVEELETRASILPSIPPGELPSTIDFNAEDTNALITRQIFVNMKSNNYCLPIDVWKSIIEKIQYGVNHQNLLTKNALSSLFLILSYKEYDDRLWVILNGGICEEKHNFAEVKLPDVAVAFLQSPNAEDAFHSFEHSNDYKIPPTVVTCHDTNMWPLRGWVAFNNVIVVNQIYTNAIRSYETGGKLSGRLMDFLTLLGHETKHGDIRSKFGRYSFHTPKEGVYLREKQVMEAGMTWEIEFWKGIWPRWWIPNDENAADTLASTLLKRLLLSGDIVLNEEDLNLLKSVVGDRRDTKQPSQLPLLFYFSMNQFLE